MFSDRLESMYANRRLPVSQSYHRAVCIFAREKNRSRIPNNDPRHIQLWEVDIEVPTHLLL